MRIKNRTLNLLYITISVIISGYGLNLSLGIFEGSFSILPLSYSDLSNIICFMYFVACLVHGVMLLIKNDTSKEICIFPRFKGAVTMCVIFTLLIFHFILFRGSYYLPGTNSLDWRNLIIHYITPMLAVLHWLIFDKKGVYKKIDSLFWLAIPIVYMIYSFIYAEVGSRFFYNGAERYPYYFINPDRVGWTNVGVYVAGLFVFFLLLGFAICIADKYMDRLGPEQTH